MVLVAVIVAVITTIDTTVTTTFTITIVIIIIGPKGKGFFHANKKEVPVPEDHMMSLYGFWFCKEGRV